MRLKIKAERQKLGMLQREIYQNLCSKRHYQRIEKGEVIPSVYLLYKISRKLNINMEELIILEDFD